MAKTPYKLLVVREALIWRTEEIARCACDAIERDDLAVAGILARATMESAGIVWRLDKLLRQRRQKSTGEIDAELMRLLVGSRLWEDGPQAIQILKMIDGMEKDVPGSRRAYEILCEYAHPNWMGTVGLYSRIDRDRWLTNVGRGLGHRGAKPQILEALVGSLQLFEHAYNSISEALPAYIEEFEKIDPAPSRSAE